MGIEIMFGPLGGLKAHQACNVCLQTGPGLSIKPNTTASSGRRLASITSTLNLG